LIVAPHGSEKTGNEFSAMEDPPEHPGIPGSFGGPFFVARQVCRRGGRFLFEEGKVFDGLCWCGGDEPRGLVRRGFGLGVPRKLRALRAGVSFLPGDPRAL